MEAMYTEELRASVNLLMANLESQPVAKDFKPKIKPKLTPMNSFLDMGEEGDLPLSKSDVVLSFTLEVSQMGVWMISAVGERCYISYLYAALVSQTLQVPEGKDPVLLGWLMKRIEGVVFQMKEPGVASFQWYEVSF